MYIITEFFTGLLVRIILAVCVNSRSLSSTKLAYSTRMSPIQRVLDLKEHEILFFAKELEIGLR